MKKYAAIVAVILAVIACAAVFDIADIETASAFSQAECDRLFAETVDELMTDRGYASAYVSADKRNLYDIALSPLGVLYTFYADDTHGYAIVVEGDLGYEVAEVFFDAESPFANIGDGAAVYVANSIYLSYDNGTYYFAENGAEVPEAVLVQLAEVAYYCGGSVIEHTCETVYFKHKDEQSYSAAFSIPRNTDSFSALPAACSPIAAGNIVMYYDRYHSNMIPDYTPGASRGDLYGYKPQDDTMNAVIAELYSDMGTSSIGTTVGEFKSGMRKYAARYGYDFAFSSCMSGGNINYDLAKSKIEEGYPVALFVKKFNAATIMNTGDRDVLDIINAVGNHTMAAFGYKDITYTLNDGSVRHDRYLHIATGISISPVGYFNVNYNAVIDDAYIVSVV